MLKIRNNYRIILILTWKSLIHLSANINVTSILNVPPSIWLKELMTLLKFNAICIFSNEPSCRVTLLVKKETVKLVRVRTRRHLWRDTENVYSRLKMEILHRALFLEELPLSITLYRLIILQSGRSNMSRRYFTMMMRLSVDRPVTWIQHAFHSTLKSQLLTVNLGTCARWFLLKEVMSDLVFKRVTMEIVSCHLICKRLLTSLRANQFQNALALSSIHSMAILVLLVQMVL